MERLKYLLPAVAVTLLVFVGSVASTSTIQELNPLELNDKIIHFTGYFVVTAAWLFGLSKISIKSPALWAFSIATIVGVIIEVVQYYFFPGRFFEILDIIANISGSLIGVLIIKKFI